MKVEAPRAGGPPPPSARLHPFFASLYASVPRPYVTYALIAINAIVFGAMVASGIHPISPDTQSLVAWGANFGPATRGPEPWRLFTSMFLHGGALHLVFNMSALRQLGSLVERMYGHVGFASLFVISGLGGSAVSVYFTPNVVSVGASGAIFGVVGALVAFLVVRRKEIPRAVYAGLRSSALTTILFTAALGFMIPNIDNAAHGGGFLVGVLCGLVQAPFASGPRREHPLRVAVATLVGAAAVGGIYLALPRSTRVPDEQNAEARAELISRSAAWFDRAGRANFVVETAVASVRAAATTGPEAAARIETEVLPDLRGLVAELDAMGELGREDAALRESYRQYFMLEITAATQTADGLRAGDEAKIAQGRETLQRAADFLVARRLRE